MAAPGAVLDGGSLCMQWLSRRREEEGVRVARQRGQQGPDEEQQALLRAPHGSDSLACVGVGGGWIRKVDGQ